MIKQIRNKKAFTLIELIVVMTVIGVLVLLAMPKFIGHTQQAKLTQIKADTKQLENASERYYMDKQDWPRLSDTPYTSAQITTFAQEIKDKTGQIVTLDSSGSYYDVDYAKLQSYIQKPKNDIHYIIQNPVGEVYYLDKLTTLGNNRQINNPPIAVITMTPNTGLLPSTNIIWSYNSSTDTDGDMLLLSEWTVDGVITQNPNGTFSGGNHTMSLRVKDNRGLWSDSVSKTFTIVVSYNKSFNFLGNYEAWTAPYTGRYKLEVWGSQGSGASGSITGGLGGYVGGEKLLTQGDILYIYVGGPNGYNALSGGGGLSGNVQGGGGTDIRTAGQSLTDRLIVAGGGGGGDDTEYSYTFNGKGGNGGLTGINGVNAYYLSHNANGATGAISGGNRGGIASSSMFQNGGPTWYAITGGGGGGSSYLGTLQNATGITGIESGNGRANITYLSAE